jgi:hypothetical protein
MVDAPHDDAPSDVWCRVVVSRPGASARLLGAIGGPGRPDLGVVSRLSRWALSARRGGAALVVREVCEELLELLELTGLGGQMRGQAEDGEDPLGVEEGVDGRDPAP